MPVSPTYPGVYIEEVPSGVHTITGVATSIAAFLGRTSKGPMNRAVRILSQMDFERKFGKPHPESRLADSVRQFFDNGGTDSYVVRLASGAQAATVTLTDIVGNGTLNHNVLTATAKTPGLWGNGLRLEVDYNTPNPDETFNLVVVQLDGENEIARERHTGLSMDPGSPRFAPAFVTQSSDLIDLALHADAAARYLLSGSSSPGYSQSRAFPIAPLTGTTGFRAWFEKLLTDTPKFEMNVDDEGYIPIDLSDVLGLASGQIPPSSTWALGAMETRLTSVMTTQLGDAVPGLAVGCTFTPGTTSPSALRITATSGKTRSVRIRRSADKDFAVPMMLGLDQGGVEVVRYSNFRPVPTAAFFIDVGKFVNMAALIRNQVSNVSIDGSAPITLDFTALSPNSADLWFVDQAGNGDGVREKLRAIVRAVNDTAGMPWRAELWGYHLAFIAEEGSINKQAASVPFTTVPPDPTLNGFCCNVRQYALGNTGTGSYQQLSPSGTIGTDGAAPTLTEFQGSETDHTGLYALDLADLFNLMVIPGDDGVGESIQLSLWGPASIYCEKRRALLLIDAPGNWTKSGQPDVVTNTSLVNDLRAKVVKRNSAVFYPRLQYFSKGLSTAAGASGAIAGLMARIDSTRGVWKAPAGVEADIRGIIGLNVKLTDMENGVLNKLGVNCLREFPTGYVNWGARTMDGSDDDSSEWKYIPIRRLALFLEESLFRGTKWVVFEPNDEPLWAKIRLNLGAFMMRLFRQGAFQGSTPDKAFFVKCDGETTTQADRDLGIVNILVGFASLKPAEFVIIRIQQIAGEL